MWIRNTEEKIYQEMTEMDDFITKLDADKVTRNIQAVLIESFMQRVSEESAIHTD